MVQPYEIITHFNEYKLNQSTVGNENKITYPCHSMRVTLGRSSCLSILDSGIGEHFIENLTHVQGYKNKYFSL